MSILKVCMLLTYVLTCVNELGKYGAIGTDTMVKFMHF
jgi:hypothetical protein